MWGGSKCSQTLRTRRRSNGPRSASQSRKIKSGKLKVLECYFSSLCCNSQTWRRYEKAYTLHFLLIWRLTTWHCNFFWNWDLQLYIAPIIWVPDVDLVWRRGLRSGWIVKGLYTNKLNLAMVCSMLNGRGLLPY